MDVIASDIADLPITVGHQEPPDGSLISLRLIQEALEQESRCGRGTGGSGRRTVHPRNHTLLPQGVPRGEVHFLHSGILRLQRICWDGRRQVLSLVLPGELVGVNRKASTHSSVETCTGAVLYRFDRTLFDAAVTGNEDFRRVVLRHQDRRLERLRYMTWAVGALRPAERICAFLAIATRFMPVRRLEDGSLLLTHVLPRSDIAALLSTSVETISRVTQQLRQSGLIDMPDASHFRIIDPVRLDALGGVEDRLLIAAGLPARPVDVLPSQSLAKTAHRWSATAPGSAHSMKWPPASAGFHHSTS